MARRARDVEVEVNVSFEDSLRGVETRIPVELESACTTCAGTGAEPGTTPVICPECRGRGVVSESQGLFALSQPCPRCGGNGTVIEKPCAHLPRLRPRSGATKRYTVKIPAGVKDGTRIKLKGKGEAGHRRRPAGDLHVVTRVAASPLYERKGSDLVLEVPVTYAEAALGAEVEVPTPEGRISLKVPARLAGRPHAPRPRSRRAEAERRRRRATCSRACASRFPTKLHEGRARGGREPAEGLAREPAGGRVS